MRTFLKVVVMGGVVSLWLISKDLNIPQATETGIVLAGGTVFFFFYGILTELVEIRDELRKN